MDPLARVAQHDVVEDERGVVHRAGCPHAGGQVQAPRHDAPRHQGAAHQLDEAGTMSTVCTRDLVERG